MERLSDNRTAVVILNWNGAELLERFLPRVVANTKGADIIVADNCSDDNSKELLRDQFPGIRVMALDKNYGYAGGYNRAVERLEGYDHVILLNSDAAPAEGWIGYIAESFKGENVVAVQPKILSENDRGSFEYAGAAGGFIDRYGYPYCRGRIFNTVEKDHGQYDSATDLFWASGAAMAVKRDAYLAAGGLDEAFFAHMEEIDLCWRLKLDGGRVVYQPKAVVYHLGGGSLDSSSPQKTYLNFRNNLLMLYKNLPQTKGKDRLLFKRRLLDTLAWAKFMATGKFRHGSAILKAHRDFKKMRKGYTHFPQQNLLAEECRQNILSSYYLKGRKTYNSLK